MRWEEWSRCVGRGEGAEEWEDVKPREIVQLCFAALQEARDRALLNRLQGQSRSETCASAGEAKLLLHFREHAQGKAGKVFC